MKRAGTSERYQNNNLKAIIAYSKFLDHQFFLMTITKKVHLVYVYNLPSFEIEIDILSLTTLINLYIDIGFFRMLNL